MLKKLVKNLKPSSTLLINETSKKLEDQGKKIFKFGFGQSPFKVPEDVVEELKNNAYQNKYLPMQGLDELRELKVIKILENLRLFIKIYFYQVVN